jgi:hypothetical protein
MSMGLPSCCLLFVFRLPRRRTGSHRLTYLRSTMGHAARELIPFDHAYETTD